MTATQTKSYLRKIQLDDNRKRNDKVSSKLVTKPTRNQIKRNRHNLWIQLISSDWFICFLDYLWFDDIVKLDTAFCNHIDRFFLKCYIPDVAIECDDIANWMISKSILLDDISVECSSIKLISK